MGVGDEVCLRDRWAALRWGAGCRVLNPSTAVPAPTPSRQRQNMLRAGQQEGHGQIEIKIIQQTRCLSQAGHVGRG
jgi:hypothetical protein